MVQRAGLYGGSFDPIHLGHLSIATAVADQLNLDEVIFLPSAQPPHKTDIQLTPIMHRAEMVRLAIADFPIFSFSDYDLERPGPTFTIDTVKHFRKTCKPGTELFWIIGEDSLLELPTWHRIAEFVDLCQIVTAARKTTQQLDWNRFHPVLNDQQIESLRRGMLETPIVDISATDIRSRLAQGRQVQSEIPKIVRQYIQQHGLYTTSPN